MWHAILAGMVWGTAQPDGDRDRARADRGTVTGGRGDWEPVPGQHAADRTRPIRAAARTGRRPATHRRQVPAGGRASRAAWRGGVLPVAAAGEPAAGGDRGRGEGPVRARLTANA